MAKVKINNLPPGVTIEDGKIKQSMQSGGQTTGDQFDYGLVTNVKAPDKENTSRDIDVRHSLAAVPRDQANIEAEGGETVLTDLDNDGLFGLYDIKGPRHSNGGVPMNLPEQSFIFSDTTAMKLTPKELKEFDIQSRKKMTPAQVSKKFDLNKYYGSIKDQYADDIQVKSAELMMDKNKKSLSKLAFVQESKKNFEDGVPVASYPYLVSQNIDPIQFTQQVEQISMERAQQKAIEALPPDQQQQLMMLQQFLQQSDGELPEAQYGVESRGIPSDDTILTNRVAYFGQPVAQQPEIPVTNGKPEDTILTNRLAYFGPSANPLTNSTEPFWQYSMSNPPESNSADPGDTITTNRAAYFGPPINPLTGSTESLSSNILNNMPVSPVTPETSGDIPIITENQLQAAGMPSAPIVNNQVVEPEQTVPSTTPPKQGRVASQDPNANQQMFTVMDPGVADKYKQYNLTIGTRGVGETEFARVQPTSQMPGRFGDASKNEVGWFTSWSSLYPQAEALIESLESYTPGKGEKYNNPEVRAFQDWYQNQYLPEEVNRINEQIIAAGRAPLTSQQKADLLYDLRQDTGFTGTTGKLIDGKFGTKTSSLRPLDFTVDPLEVKDKTPEEIQEEAKLQIDPVETPKPKDPTAAKFWLQDLIQLNAIANRDRSMFFPFQPAVTPVDIGYILEDPTRGIAAVNEQLGLTTQAIGAFGGPQSMMGRTAQAQAKAAADIANTLARTNQRNVSTVNRGLAQQAQMDYRTGLERRERTVKAYDDTQKVLQNYETEKNYDREQYAMALSNALTNRANTYNLNTTQDYYQIDPTTGGMIGQFSSKAFEPAPVVDPMANIMQYADLSREWEARTGQQLPAEILKVLMGQQSTPQETNIQRAYRNTPMAYGQAYQPGSYPMSTAKAGKEVKKTILPFSIGKIGG